MTITEDHKRKAKELVQSIKDANPQHASFFEHIEKAAESFREHVVEGAENAMFVPAMLFLFLLPNASGKPLFT